jgi:hypothetical protein
MRFYYTIIFFLLICLPLSAQTMLYVSDITPGTEKTKLVNNGDFETGEQGWQTIGSMFAEAPPAGIDLPDQFGNLTAVSHIDNHTINHFNRTVVLEGNTQYVLSAYMWHLGDSDHYVNVVIDLNDKPWEGQIALYPHMTGTDQGVFVYTTFTTPPTSQRVTLRIFNEAITETDDNWPYYPAGAMWDNISITRADEFSPPFKLHGDLNGDVKVNISDLDILSRNWLFQECDNIADVTPDCNVNMKDMFKLAAEWLYENETQGPLVDTTTLTGKVMCGYQGWFTCPGDGANMGWTHWDKGGVFQPGNCTIDLWPDMSEMDVDEKFPTSFQHADGSTAYVFSSYKSKTVDRHFKWMKSYGIDGAFVQRFAVETMGQPNLNRTDTVLLNCKQAANQHGRAYAVMYDLSGLSQNQMTHVINDFKHLVDDFNITRDQADNSYLHHNGKPVVAVWGIGFDDGRDYTLDECLTLVNFLKNDSVYGGCTVMLGVPSNWRTLNGDCVSDPKVHDIILAADIVSPWSVGRFGSDNSSELDNYVNNVWQPDKVWCDNNSKEYLPVVFPGFSWYNMQGWGLDHIPRQGGQFLWRQYYEAINQAGVAMVYQAMFDEVDEGTAIFKCFNDPPVGDSPFLKYDEGNGEQPDHYLWLTGRAAKMLTGELTLNSNMPQRYSYDLQLDQQLPGRNFEGIGWTIQPADMINGGWNQQKPLLDYAQHDTWRVMLYPMLWEPVNDNSDPWDYSGFNWNTPFMAELELLLQYAKDNDITVEIANWSCGWMQPGDSCWMGAYGTSAGPPDSDYEFAESICALVHYLKNTKGYDNILRVSLWNEPSAHFGGDYPEQFCPLYKAVHAYLAWISPALRNTIELVACDDHDYWRQYIGPTLNYYVDCLWNVDAGTDAVSMHHYNGDSIWMAECIAAIENNNIDGIVEPLYMYELGGNQLPMYAAEQEKYRYSLEQASNTIDAINYGAQLVAYWIWDGGGLQGYGATEVGSCGTKPNSAMYYPAALVTRAVSKNSNVCDITVENNHGSYIKAAKLVSPQDKTTVILTNDNQNNHGCSTVTLHFNDLSEQKRISALYTDHDNHYNAIYTLGRWSVSPQNCSITIDVPDESIIVFVELNDVTL